MSYTPTSPAGIAIAQLRRMVSLSSTFQTATGAATASAALAFILVGRVAASTLTAQNGGVIYENNEGGSFQMYAGGDQLHLAPTGRLTIDLVYTLSGSDDATDQYLKGIDFLNNVGKDVAALSGAEDTGSAFSQNHLDITEIRRRDSGPGDIRHDASRGLLFFGKLDVDWGIK